MWPISCHTIKHKLLNVSWQARTGTTNITVAISTDFYYSANFYWSGLQVERGREGGLSIHIEYKFLVYPWSSCHTWTTKKMEAKGNKRRYERADNAWVTGEAKGCVRLSLPASWMDRQRHPRPHVLCFAPLVSPRAAEREVISIFCGNLHSSKLRTLPSARSLPAICPDWLESSGYASRKEPERKQI